MRNQGGAEIALGIPPLIHFPPRSRQQQRCNVQYNVQCSTVQCTLQYSPAECSVQYRAVPYTGGILQLIHSPPCSSQQQCCVYCSVTKSTLCSAVLDSAVQFEVQYTVQYITLGSVHYRQAPRGSICAPSHLTSTIVTGSSPH